jgi:hypothetical protein
MEAVNADAVNEFMTSAYSNSASIYHHFDLSHVRLADAFLNCSSMDLCSLGSNEFDPIVGGQMHLRDGATAQEVRLLSFLIDMSLPR